MKPHIHIHAIILALALPLTAYTAEQAERGVPKSGDTAKTPDPAAEKHPFIGQITAISPENKTITVNDAQRGAHKLQIGEKTKIMRGDKTATWDDLKVGALVEGTCMGNKEAAQAETVTIKE